MEIKAKVFSDDRNEIRVTNNVTTVIGPNGCGKSRLLRTINNIGDFNRDANKHNFNSIYVYQKYFLEYFPEPYGDGFQRICELCDQLASHYNPIIIENPENFLHIEVQEHFMDAVNDLYGDKEDVFVFVETHSPYIINGCFNQIAELERKGEE